MKPTDFTLKTTKLDGTLQLYVPRPKKVDEILKPTSGFQYTVIWTSTAQKTQSGYTSAWVEWCSMSMPQWLTNKGILYKVSPGAKVLSMNTDKDAFAIAKYYGLAPPKDDIEKLLWARNFPWDEIEDDYDGIHHEPSGSRFANILMSTWDVESTAWFNTNHLQQMGEVRVSP